jgi:serine/threonine protein kinase
MSDPEPNAASALKELSGRIGKYEILKPLGKGAMGMVYLAHDTILERDVARPRPSRR